MRASPLLPGATAMRWYLCVSGAALAYGQLPPPEPAARSQLVDLNVVALDSRNQPVADLTAADFQIADAGKPQRIVFFRHNQAASAGRRTPGPARVHEPPAGGARQPTVVLFDVLNDARAPAPSPGRN